MKLLVHADNFLRNDTTSYSTYELFGRQLPLPVDFVLGTNLAGGCTRFDVKVMAAGLVTVLVSPPICVPSP